MNSFFYIKGKQIATFMALSLLLMSCNDKVGLEQQIPKESAAVAVVNTKSLFTKIALDQIGNLSIESIFGGEGTNRPPVDPNSDEAKWRTLMNDPSQLGIDLLEDAYLVLGEVKNAKPSYGAVMLRLSDPKKLLAYIENEPPTALKNKPLKGEGFSYIFLEEENAILTWDDQVLTIMVSFDKKAPSLEDVSRIYNLPKDHTIAELTSFNQFMKGSRDIGVFMNIRDWMANTPTHLLNRNLAQLPADYIGMQFNFDDGLVDIRMHQYLPEQSHEMYQNMLTGVRLSEMFQTFDMESAIGFANLRYTEAQVRKFVADNPFAQAQLTPLLAGIGFSEDKFYHLFKGGVMVACTGIGTIKKEVTVHEMDEEFNMVEKKEVKEVPSAQFILALETNDQDMRTLLDGLSKALMVRPVGEGYKITYPGLEDDGWMISLQEGKCVITNQTASIDATYQNSNSIYDMTQKSPMSFFVDIEQVIDAFPIEFGRDGVEARKIFSHIQAMVSAQEKGVIDASIELHLKETDRNSLLQMIAAIQKWNKEGGSLPF